MAEDKAARPAAASADEERVLGSGLSGEVVLGRFRGIPCAIKRNPKAREVEILKQLVSKQSEGYLTYVVPILCATPTTLAMPQGLDMTEVVRDCHGK